jgi:ABC-type glycerol-3-phosphate transport system substrate-binding protein
VTSFSQRFRSLLAQFIVVLSIFNLTGCSSSGKGSSDTSVVVWHWMSDREPAFQTLAAKYESVTGKKVRFELYAPSESYVQKVRAAAQTNTLPDIYGVLGEPRDFAGFVKAGHVADLSTEMNKDDGEWMKRFFDKALVNGRFAVDNGYGVTAGIYGVPLDVTNIQMLYNKDLFKAAGLNPETPPQTWKDFLAMGPAFKKIGVPGFVSGWGELWLIDCFASNLAFNLMGEEKVLKTIKGEVPYTDPDWVRLFTLFDELRDSGILGAGVVSMVNKTAEQTFANGRAALSFNGSWGVNVYSGMNPSLNYGACLPPAVSDAHPRVIWGGAGSTLVVNAKSARKDDAIAFLKWLTEKDQQVFLSQETKNLPAVHAALENVPTILSQFADDMESTTHPSRFPVSEASPVIESFDKGIQSILIREKTPKQVAEEVQKVKVAEMKKAASRAAQP